MDVATAQEITNKHMGDHISEMAENISILAAVDELDYDTFESTGSTFFTTKIETDEVIEDLFDVDSSKYNRNILRALARESNPSMIAESFLVYLDQLINLETKYDEFQIYFQSLYKRGIKYLQRAFIFESDIEFLDLHGEKVRQELDYFLNYGQVDHNETIHKIQNPEKIKQDLFGLS